MSNFFNSSADRAAARAERERLATNPTETDMLNADMQLIKKQIEACGRKVVDVDWGWMKIETDAAVAGDIFVHEDGGTFLVTRVDEDAYLRDRRLTTDKFEAIRAALAFGEAR